MHHNLLGGDFVVSNAFVPEGLNVGFINVGNEQGLEGLVCHVVLGIKVRFDVIFTGSVCDLCCRQSLRNDGIWAKIGR